MDVTINVETGSTFKLLKKLEGRIQEALKNPKLEREAVRVLKIRAPFRTGRLRRSIRVIRKLGFIRQIGMLKYGWYLEKGVKPHMIFPKKAKALHFWTVTGEEVFTKRVKHPGIIPMRWISMGAREVRDRLHYMLKQLVTMGLRRDGLSLV